MELDRKNYFEQQNVRKRSLGNLPITACPKSRVRDLEHYDSLDSHDFSYEEVKSCQLQSTIVPERITEPYINHHIREHLKNLRLLSDSSVYGQIFIADFAGGEVIIKTSQRQQGIDKAVEENELAIGLNAVNYLRKYTPNYIFTYGAFKCGPPFISDKGEVTSWCGNAINMQTYSVIELIPNSKSIMLSCVADSFMVLQSLMCQIVYSIAIAYKYVNFVHADLHGGNVLVEDIGEDAILLYRFNENEAPYMIKTRYIARIIDYGLSRATDQITGEKLGITTINDTNSPINDFIRILSNCLYAVTHNEVVEKDSKIKFLNLIIAICKTYKGVPISEAITSIAGKVAKRCDPELFKAEKKEYIGLYNGDVSFDDAMNSLVSSKQSSAKYLTDFVIRAKEKRLSTQDVNDMDIFFRSTLPRYEEILKLADLKKIAKTQNDAYGIYTELGVKLRELEIARRAVELTRKPELIMKLNTSTDLVRDKILQIMSKMVKK